MGYMTDGDLLADRFEENRPHLRAVAYRMLGSLAEADDAVQEAWLRLNRADAAAVDNLGGWLTTVVGRVCLDMLRSRNRRNEEPLDPAEDAATVAAATGAPAADPEQEALLADSVGFALLVVLDTLTPVERLAFVLHDLFAVPFEEIAPIVGRSPAAARQLASRARRRVRAGDATVPEGGSHSREIVDAFLAAARKGEFGALLRLLDPDVALRADAAAVQLGGSEELRGAEAVAGFFSGRAQGARTALIDGAIGLVVVFDGEVRIAVTAAVEAGRITGLDAIADPARLRELDVVVLDAG
jgi:RNA polymerase sigma-70 factor (ECF subfamily)